MVGDLTPTSDHSVMMTKHRDVSSSVLSDSAKSGRWRNHWVSPRRLLERVKTRKSWGSPGQIGGKRVGGDVLGECAGDAVD